MIVFWAVFGGALPLRGALARALVARNAARTVAPPRRRARRSRGQRREGSARAAHRHPRRLGCLPCRWIGGRRRRWPRPLLRPIATAVARGAGGGRPKCHSDGCGPRHGCAGGCGPHGCPRGRDDARPSLGGDGCTLDVCAEATAPEGGGARREVVSPRGTARGACGRRMGGSRWFLFFFYLILAAAGDGYACSSHWQPATCRVGEASNPGPARGAAQMGPPPLPDVATRIPIN